MIDAHADLHVHPATVADAPAVLAVLDDAAAWLRGRRIVQWPAAFRPEWIEPALTEGRVWLASLGAARVPAATLTLDWSDPLWPDDGAAGYLHRFAVRRAAAGVGARLLRWAGAAVAARDRDLLRLDCGAANAGLRGYYERAGFAHRGDVELPGTHVR